MSRKSRRILKAYDSRNTAFANYCAACDAYDTAHIDSLSAASARRDATSAIYRATCEEYQDATAA